MVDDIIKDKDGARRRMLEQAAGISIYKTRKKEARQKLDLTEADLARIEDLLFEIAGNVRTLESQAKKAERYFTLKGEYKTVSIELAKAGLEDFNDRYKALTEEQQREEERKAALDASLATEEAAVEAEKVALLTKEQELNGLQKAFNETLNRIRTLESDVRLGRQRLEHLREREASGAKNLEQSAAQLKSLEESVATAEKAIAVETETVAASREEVEKLRKDAEEKRAAFEAHKRALDALRREQQQEQHKRYEAEKRAAVADSSVTNLQRALAQLEEEKAHRASQIASIAADRQKAEETLGQKQTSLEELTRRQEEVKEKILASGEELEGLRAKLVEENRALDSRRNEHNLLKSLVDSLEGYPDSIKYLAKNKEWNVGAPLLSDVFVVKQEYRTAIESVLEPYLNHYVVQNIAEAAAAIRLLEGAKKGKASFLLLDHINDLVVARGDVQHVPPAQGSVPALDAVEVEGKYKSLAAHLLGNVFIQDTLSDGAYEDGHILVEKSGRAKTGNAAVTGGSVGAFEGNKIGRAKNLERLSKEIGERTEVTQALKSQVADLQQRIAGFNAALADRTLETTRREVIELQSRIGSLGHRIEHFEQLDAGASARVAQLETQLAEAMDAIAGTKGELGRATEQLDLFRERISAADVDVRSVETAFNEAIQQYNAHNLDATRLQSRLDNLKQEHRFRTQQIEDLRRSIQNTEQGLATAATDIAQTAESLAQTEAALLEGLRSKESEERRLNETDRAYYAARAALQQRESGLGGTRREREAADVLLTSIREKLSEMKLRLAGLKERLQVEFKVVLEEILDEPRTGELSVPELEAEAERLKRRIEGLGEVNPTAVEAFTEMKARHDFIAEQKGDLVSAKDSLLATIEEVENTANTRFRETFDAVRENFTKVFKALFTEDDNADLRLTDENDMAETGIEIYAQPKGKKPSTLTQLSGGEKTLTSTAFLFAIYLIKPAPFCILDEVDAPLDDANVGKFTNMIRQFSDRSQFIIVTHNKQTMAAVDVIYGVTMQEPGVSKLVPVDFRSLN
jgi:chromosome segregation protein